MILCEMCMIEWIEIVVMISMMIEVMVIMIRSWFRVLEVEVSFLLSFWVMV